MSAGSWSKRFPRIAVLGVAVVLWGLVACQTRPPAPSPPPTPPPVAETAAIPAGAHEYRVVPEDSLLQVLVYRGGAMARLGHNHVIASHDLGGSVWLADDEPRSRFDIRIPVDRFTVDEPALREQAGPDFPPGVPQSARDGTRRNLLSDALLDGARYPEIRLRATDVAAAANGYDVAVEITIKDATRVVRVPVTIERTPGALVVTGEFPLKQSELGLQPFSVGLGALVVLDDMRVRFRVTARAVD